MKEFKITCSYKDALKLDDLQEFQGELKHRDAEDYKKIVKSIEKYGFSFPFFVWQNGGKNLVLDGHGRLGALRKMRDEGMDIGEVPVVYVNLKSEKEAKDLLLRLNSSYGKMSKKSVADFIGQDFDLNLDDYQLPAFSLDLTNPFEPVDDEYKKALERAHHVPLTTTAPSNPIVNEMPLEGGYEPPLDEYIQSVNEVADDEDYSVPIGEMRKPPEDFKSYDEEIPTKCKCPRCGYEW